MRRLAAAFPWTCAGYGYSRELHLIYAIAETDYKAGAANFRREVFVAYPDQALVLRLTSDQPWPDYIQRSAKLPVNCLVLST